MARKIVSGRVTESQVAALRAYADRAGLPFYQATVRALEVGISVLVARQGRQDQPETVPSGDGEAITSVLGELLARAERGEALLRQILSAGGTAFAEAPAALGDGIGESPVNGQVASPPPSRPAPHFKPEPELPTFDRTIGGAL